MDPKDLHAQRCVDVTFIADAVRQLNAAELSGSPRVRELMEYLERGIVALRRHARTAEVIQASAAMGEAQNITTCPACNSVLPASRVRGICDPCKAMECAHESHSNEGEE